MKKILDDNNTLKLKVERQLKERRETEEAEKGCKKWSRASGDTGRGYGVG